jgi:broad specificity phosphatase PhoE
MPTQEVNEKKVCHSRILSWKEISKRLQSPIIFPNTKTLHLIRHAETESNAGGRITGAQDVKLSVQGEKQGSQLGQKLDDCYDIAYCSTLERSRKTLELALSNGQIKVGKVIEDERLNERSLGVLEGQKRQMIAAYAAGDLNYAPQEGESYTEVALRIFSFLLDLTDLCADNEINKVLICGHMGPMRILVGIIEEEKEPATVLAFSFPNAKVLKLNWSQLKIPEFLEDCFSV